MRKLLSVITIFMLVFCITIPTFAADEYGFELQYDGPIVKNVEKDAKVLLIGVNGTLHTNVRIKIDITGPATPKILATDTTDVEHDIAQTGYWGADTGFAVQGDFTNTTPIKATFIEEGNYQIKLSLIDVTNPDLVYATKTIDIQVFEDAPGDITNEMGNNIVNNTVEELPKTGTSVVEYTMYIIAIVLVVSIIGIYLNRKRINA